MSTARDGDRWRPPYQHPRGDCRSFGLTNAGSPQAGHWALEISRHQPLKITANETRRHSSRVASLGVHCPSVVDADGSVSRALHAPAYLPVSFAVTSDGTVRQVLPPRPFWSPEQVDRTVRALASGTT
jgi:hypothetical protein